MVMVLWVGMVVINDLQVTLKVGATWFVPSTFRLSMLGMYHIVNKSKNKQTKHN